MILRRTNSGAIRSRKEGPVLRGTFNHDLKILKLFKPLRIQLTLTVCRPNGEDPIKEPWNPTLSHSIIIHNFLSLLHLLLRHSSWYFRPQCGFLSRHPSPLLAWLRQYQLQTLLRPPGKQAAPFSPHAHRSLPTPLPGRPSTPTNSMPARSALQQRSWLLAPTPPTRPRRAR